MSKQVLGGVLAVVALFLLGGLFFMNKSNETNKTQTAPAASTSSSNSKSDPSESSEQPASSSASQSNEVEIKGFDFVQKKITIKKGETVTWTNQDTAKHDITPDSESPDFTASELFGKGESYKFTFNKVGTYSYHCSPHPYMKAAIEVVE